MRALAGRALRRSGFATRFDINQIDATVAELSSRTGWLDRRVDGLEERERLLVEALENLKAQVGIDALTRWLRHATLNEHPLVSVVMPTKERPTQLERAIRSVIAQRYENWELLIDDDGERSAQPVVDSIADPRIVWQRNPGRGGAAARNHGLKSARGELIAYLDDDNIMDPEWLHAVVWAFEQRPEIDVLYGAHVVDDHLRRSGESSGALPRTFFNRWSRETLRQANLTDMSAIAHRAGLLGAWFDEDRGASEDWDLLLRLTAEKDPLPLPAIACYYTTDAPGRRGPTRRRSKATQRS